MTIIAEVFRELFKMFVADLRLTLAILAGVAAVSALLAGALVGPTAAGALLVALCLAVLGEAVLRETRTRRAR